MATLLLRNRSPCRHRSFTHLQHLLVPARTMSMHRAAMSNIRHSPAHTPARRVPKETSPQSERDSSSGHTSWNITSDTPNSPIKARRNNDSGSKSQSKGQPFTSMPRRFWTLPDTERLEGMDKVVVRELFSKRSAGYSTTDAFIINAYRMPFRAPPPADIPLFVQQAMSEYERAMDQYDKRLKELKTRESDLVMSTTSSIPPEPSLDPPKLPLLVVQHQLRNLRHYPESVTSPHPAFRATFVISKKQVSKLAVHRNLARKKLAAAVEMTFREHARQGYEFMIFAKQACMTTSQEKLEEYMITALKNPGLYGERASKQQNRVSKIANTSSSDITHMNDRGSTSSKSSAHKVVAVRWKNNQPPLHKDWWRHANPNPLGRVQQSNAYLDMFCEKPTKIPRTIPQRKER